MTESTESPEALDVDDHLRDHLHEFQPMNWATLRQLVEKAWTKGHAAGVERMARRMPAPESKPKTAPPPARKSERP